MATRAATVLALLLMFIAVVESCHSQSAVEKEFKDAFPGGCQACKYIVNWVKKKLGKDSSKEKIAEILNNVCLQTKSSLIREGCKKVVKKFKDKLIDVIAGGGSPLSACQKIKMCKSVSSAYTVG